jgi:hypothetical protein
MNKSILIKLKNELQQIKFQKVFLKKLRVPKTRHRPPKKVSSRAADPLGVGGRPGRNSSPCELILFRNPIFEFPIRDSSYLSLASVPFVRKQTFVCQILILFFFSVLTF